MYIVTRTFRDANGVFGVGSIVDPTSVKAFRSRLQQRHIVDVNEANLEEWVQFFKNRHGINLSDKFSEYFTEETDSSVEISEPDCSDSSLVNLESTEEDDTW